MTRVTGARPAPWLGIGLGLLSIAPVHAIHYEHSEGDMVGLVDKSWDVVAVDVDVVDIVAVRRIDKMHMTAAPLLPTDRRHVLARKVSSTCPSSYSMCAASLSGGCCPTGFACDVSDCFETTPATATTSQAACGRTGYTGCGIADGGGCCPSGYTCGRQFCTPPAGVTQSQQCPTDYYLCPSSLNYGCCRTTMGCALNGCYATTPSTIVFTATFTTTTDATGKGLVTTVTSTTVETPSAPTDTAGVVQSDSTDAYVAKLVPTTTAKVSPVAASGNSADGGGGGGSSGLTSGEIGGLIGGLVGLLIALAVATICIIRKVGRTRKAINEAKRVVESSRTKTGSGSASKPRTSLPQPTRSVINQMEVDDLLATDGQTVADDAQSTSDPIDDSQQRASTAVDTSASGSLPRRGRGDAGAARVQPPPSDTTSSSASMQYADRPDLRISMVSPATISARPRFTSDASERTDNAAGAPVAGTSEAPVELDVEGAFIPELPVAAAADDDMAVPARPRPFSNISAVSALSFSNFGSPTSAQQQQQQQPLIWTDHSQHHQHHQRHWSDSSGSGSSTGMTTPLQPRPPQPAPSPPGPTGPPPVSLDAVVEEPLHGHYGPANTVAGQTRAGAEK